MVSYPQTDMKIPVRPAPAPPSSRPIRTFQRSTSLWEGWDDGNDPFMNGNISKSSSNNSLQTVKKKPPPRPPPPKINNHGHHKQSKSSVLSSLFSKSSHRSSVSNPSSHKHIVTKDTNIVVASLIDFDSPSSSPTFTTRSSSDGVSVNSFGSDGSVSNNGNTPSGGTASLFESGFEDDFDFFGGLSSNNVKTPNTIDQKDPWSVDVQNPFSSPTHKLPQETVQTSGNTTWFNDPLENQNTVYKPTASLKPPSGTSAMPTIIRAKPNRPSTLPKPLQLLQSNLEKSKQIQDRSVSLLSMGHSNNMLGEPKFHDNCGGDISREWSPPMPSIPPPPPPENIDAGDVPIVLPELPPRSSSVNKTKTPHGIALFDYSTSHPDDLAFKSNDLIYIIKKINDEWLYGEMGSRRGMFPANFIEIIVPIDEAKSESSGHKMVTALYPFPAQQWDDLDFPEGATIKVLGQVNADWLYGEYQGKIGQFPASFVDHVPSGLPHRKI